MLNKINCFFCLAMTLSLNTDFSNTMQQILEFVLSSIQSFPANDLSLIKINILTRPCLECQDDDPRDNEAAPDAGQHVGALAGDEALHDEGHHQLGAAQAGHQVRTGQLQGPGVGGEGQESGHREPRVHGHHVGGDQDPGGGGHQHRGGGGQAVGQGGQQAHHC